VKRFAKATLLETKISPFKGTFEDVCLSQGSSLEGIHKAKRFSHWCGFYFAFKPNESPRVNKLRHDGVLHAGAHCSEEGTANLNLRELGLATLFLGPSSGVTC